MKIPLFVHVAAGVVIAGIVMRTIETGAIVFTLNSFMESFKGKTGIQTTAYQPSLNRLTMLPARNIIQAPTISYERFNGTWENGVKKCTLNTRTKDEQCAKK